MFKITVIYKQKKRIIEGKICYGFSDMFLLTDVRHAKNKPRADGNKIFNISQTFDVLSM